ncbi:tryptophan-rich sensory protein [Candidatus Woesearchaeota archaeon]|nr:tryptophan-rich sensory protein [Candidatus Woesearchaeota archaeon]MBT5272318.1 tryptophan-rich sensory protein [Candidatus Woesearchaeota archaeon]MBT6040647.1 tryptophan-rich sensory protein [Candidatus Woesearchaeota archaeon]MBT6336590.1 tryptophan-rich sensory protein [Candidatus Woesearchaeota archaeon]MBT7927480.1 tryptophan-rich sensory protein [Candidatus Woesearchaeota archaeon]
MKEILKLVLSIIICQFAGIIGSIFTSKSVSTWYVTLIKPSFNPPSWLFGPVWITLYALMGISLYLVIRDGFVGKEYLLLVFGIQLVLNMLWSLSFFGLQNPLLGFINIILLWVMIIVTMVLFYGVSKPASLLMIPYLLWVSFATVLNYFLMRLN